jgi:hypothetical protein
MEPPNSTPRVNLPVLLPHWPKVTMINLHDVRSVHLRHEYFTPKAINESWDRQHYSHFSLTQKNATCFPQSLYRFRINIARNETKMASRTGHMWEWILSLNFHLNKQNFAFRARLCKAREQGYWLVCGVFQLVERQHLKWKVGKTRALTLHSYSVFTRRK